MENLDDIKTLKQFNSLIDQIKENECLNDYFNYLYYNNRSAFLELEKIISKHEQKFREMSYLSNHFFVSIIEMLVEGKIKIVESD